MSYIVYYKFCDRWFTESFTEKEFNDIFLGTPKFPAMSWMMIPNGDNQHD